MATHFKITIITRDAFIHFGIFDKIMVQEVFETDKIKTVQILNEELLTKIYKMNYKGRILESTFETIMHQLQKCKDELIMIVEANLHELNPLLASLRYMYMVELLNQGKSEEEAKQLAENYTPENYETS